ncbi:MAG TPA: peptidoglycan-binding protein [Solirubrobacteraceae bacterium]|nr:peptidoglycan-binding protein [Solirubrobacteraceae bacterium]
MLLVLAVAVALVAPPHSPTPAHLGTAIPAGETTTVVERRTLVEHAQLDGTLGYGGALELYDRLAGTFTWLPAVGAVIGRGGTLFRLDNLPVALMYGTVPAYRTLREGIGDGPDVAELNANLVDLGFDPYRAIGDQDHFDEATAAAVRRWQEAESLPQTGEVELGRVLFAPGARRVTAVHKALGDDPPGSSAAKAPSSEGPAADKPAWNEQAPKRPHSKAGKSKRPSAKTDGSKTPSEKQPAAKDPATKEPATKEPASKEPASNGNGASPAAAPVPVLTTTATQQIVQLQVKATEQQLARVGESAPVRLPNGDVVQGQITNVGTVASESSESEKEKGGNGGGGGGNSSGSGENATISVTLALDHPVARLDKAPVSVELVKNIRRNVLAVPATALLATAGGGYAIEALEGTRRIALAVTPGMFANGYVQIEGPGVHGGLTVTEPQ